jgi:hypothetical protein
MPKAIPLWKLRREITRIQAQIRDLPAFLASLPTRLSEQKLRAAYERDFDTLTRMTNGVQHQRDRVAIFLIYQPEGVAPSVLETCRWLASEGFSPFIISNGFLDDVSRRALAAESWRLLERPNFGYDFGGYRDGIRLLSRWAVSPDQLIIMNDSIWIPMVPDLMTQLGKACGSVDIYGLLHDTKILDSGSTGLLGSRAYSYVESYFYLLNRRTWENQAFQDFWHQYRMSNAKSRTIKFGEIGFSRAMAAAGLTLDGLCRRDLFLERLRQKDNAFLKLTLKYAAYVDADLRRAADKLAARDPDAPGWREAVLDHIEQTVRRRRFNSSFPFAHDHIFGSAFMKKNREPIWAEMRRVYLQALEAGDVKPPPSTILWEIKASCGMAAPHQ